MEGKQWLIESFLLVKRSPAAWMGSLLVMFLIMLFIALMPVVQMVVLIASPVFIGGLMLGCKAQRQGLPFKFSYLFAGFDKHIAKLLAVGAIYLVGVAICSIFAFEIAKMIGYTPLEVTPQEITSDPEKLKAFLISLQIPLLIQLGLLIPLLMAFWFAPPLVIFHQMKPLKAYKLSFIACNRNMIPFLIYGIVGFIFLLALVVVTQTVAYFIPYFSLLINLVMQLMFMAIIFASIFTSYESIFEQKESENQNEPPSESPGELTL